MSGDWSSDVCSSDLFPSHDMEVHITGEDVMDFVTKFENKMKKLAFEGAAPLGGTQLMQSDWNQYGHMLPIALPAATGAMNAMFDNRDDANPVGDFVRGALPMAALAYGAHRYFGAPNPQQQQQTQTTDTTNTTNPQTNPQGGGGTQGGGQPNNNAGSGGTPPNNNNAGRGGGGGTPPNNSNAGRGLA